MNATASCFMGAGSSAEAESAAFTRPALRLLQNLGAPFTFPPLPPASHFLRPPFVKRPEEPRSGTFAGAALDHLLLVLPFSTAVPIAAFHMAACARSLGTQLYRLSNRLITKY